MDKNRWEHFFKLNGYEIWKIGTSVSTYIDLSVVQWIDVIKVNTSKIKKINHNENSKKYIFEDKPVVTFYNNNQNNNSESTYKQLINVLTSVGVVQENENYLYVNHDLIRFFDEHKNNDESLNKEIIYDFIRQNLKTSLNKYIISPLKNIDEETSNLTDYRNINHVETKFWFNVLLIIDKKYSEGKLSKNWNIKIDSDLYFNDFISNLLGKNLSESERDKNISIFVETVNEIEKITKVTEIEYEFIDISSSSIKIEELNNQLNNNKLVKKLRESQINEDIISEIISFGEFLSAWSKLNYRIPLFQRTYSWDEQMIKGLFNNIYEGSNKVGVKNFSFLNSIILMNVNNYFNIVDGQQRIISLLIIYLSVLRKAKGMRNSQAEKALIENGYIKELPEMLRSFTNENNKHYEQLYNLFYVNNESLNKNTRFYKNYNEIIRTIEEKIGDDKFEELEQIAHYLVDNVKFNINIIRDNGDDALTKVFQQLNQYSKKLGALDLLRNLIFEKTQGKQVLINLFNNSVNLFFRKSQKEDADENLKEIQAFLDAWLVKSFRADDINRINEKFYDNTTKAFEKFKILVDHYESSENIVLEMWKQVVLYEYSKTGTFDVVNKIMQSDKTTFKKEGLELKNFVLEIEDRAQEIKFMSFQIHHITSGGSKSIYAPLIWSLAEKMEIFKSKNLRNDVALLFSKALHKIEKFGALWEISFKGQSFSKQIIAISKELVTKEDEINYETIIKLYKRLFKILDPTIKNQAQNDWILTYKKKMYETYNYEKIDDSKSFSPANNKFYKIIIGRVFNGFHNSNQPFWFEGYRSYEEKNNSIDFINYSYEHVLPQKPNKELENILEENNIDLTTKYSSLVYKIGNGILLNKNDNSKMSNKSNKSYITHGIKNITTQSVKIPGIKSLFDDKKEISISSLPLVNEEEIYNFSLDSFCKLEKSINKRTEDIIDAYIYILFSDDFDK
ncbi:hypothetical protein MCANPG14_02076 [Mycoplasmopsis canis PG 14]|uniref:Protein of uncharacterized function DUF262 n=1 Tax=Mycoplasmopsis canis TaxID=29555 RepID=A0A449ARF6_9BACT|nr:DUF262 domain-containing protein [Mycoplasmopsis canis]AMD81111.1 hypothetical protein AXW82_00855 [Mycoplasmopsis canis PG 14]EIE39823.1 hypothetical protein MCANPG14_02076 [Mycoplasmopsis canis PG 14]VEU68932.1 Protein of uncharacterised function DUF262 [Mycoplasmopsis canis]